MKANSVKTFLTPRTAQIVGLICGGTIFSGCVLVEKYAAEKARSMNFQRLLAQDERRMTELDSEVKRAKRELAEYERTNWELTAQTQTMRQEMASVQEENEAIRDSRLYFRIETTEKRMFNISRNFFTNRCPLSIACFSHNRVSQPFLKSEHYMSGATTSWTVS